MVYHYQPTEILLDILYGVSLSTNRDIVAQFARYSFRDFPFPEHAILETKTFSRHFLYKKNSVQRRMGGILIFGVTDFMSPNDTKVIFFLPEVKSPVSANKLFNLVKRLHDRNVRVYTELNLSVFMVIDSVKT
jgi:hypothetical protein